MLINLLQNGLNTITLALLLAYVLALLIGFCLHEFAHAFVAVKQGDLTPKAYGRLTLNPAKHIDPLGFLLLILVGFGYAKPVPINPYNFKNGKKSDFLVSFAGIFVNLCLAILFCFFQALIYRFGSSLLNVDNFFGIFLIFFINYMIVINFCLAFFNLLPIFPLDGFRMVESMTKPNNKFVEFMQKYSQFIILGLFVIFMLGFNFIGTAASYAEYGFTWVFVKMLGG